MMSPSILRHETDQAAADLPIPSEGKNTHKAGPLPGGAANSDGALMLFHDALTDPETESGAGVRLGGKERFKQTSPYLAIDAGASLNDGDTNPGSVPLWNSADGGNGDGWTRIAGREVFPSSYEVGAAPCVPAEALAGAHGGLAGSVNYSFQERVTGAARFWLARLKN